MMGSKRLKTLLIILSIVCAIATVIYIVLAATDVLANRTGIDVLFAIMTPILYMALAIVIARYVSALGVEKRIHQENIYYLGKDIGFFNYYLFESRVKHLNRFGNKNAESYIIATCPMKLSILRNNIKNDIVIDYVSRLADEIENKFRIEDKEFYKTNAFCYYHGLFVFYVFGDVDKINSIAAKIETMMYDIAINNKLNVYVQPYFGINKVTKGVENLLVDVENAAIARGEAERIYKTVEYFKPEMDHKTDMNQVNELLEALANKEFVVYYQPKFNLNTNTFTSSEALIRWNSSKHGFVSPAKFIEIAENGGIIHDVDMYVFERVCEEIKENKKRGRKILPASVNFSMQEFYDTDFVDSLVDICKKYNVPTSLLYIEITERTSQVNSFMTNAIVNSLKRNGFKVLMDDFGTGYSNIQNLLNIPFDAIKIDRSYIMNIDTDPKTLELVRLIINLCKANNITVVAEGVDNQNQVELLKKLKCDLIQGFYYSKPIPKEEFDKFILPNGNKFEKVK